MANTVQTGPTRVGYVNGKVQYGRGRAASVIGQTYDVYRNPTITTGLPSPVNNSQVSLSPAIASYQCKLARQTKRDFIENVTFDLLVFEGKCDVTVLELGDVLKETGYEADPGGIYTFVQRRPLQPNLFIRTEYGCSLTRPHPKGGAESQMPTTGAAAPPGYGGIPKATEQVLTLRNGFYSFVDAAPTTASVFCGLQPVRKVKDGKSLGTPTDLPRSEYLIYIPDLPGEMLNQLDRINFPNQDRYEINGLYSSGDVGVRGYIAVCEKLGV